MRKHFLKLVNNTYVLTPLYTLEVVKTIGGRKRGKHYVFPRKHYILKRLFETIGIQNFAVTPEVATDWQSEWGFPKNENFEIAHPLWKELKPWQQQAVEFLLTTPHRGALLNIDPGLGKTATAITAAHFSGAKRILVVAPLSFLPGWRYEIKKWLGENANIVHQTAVPGARWVITNYDTLVGNPSEFKRTWDVVIIDESLNFKNRKAQRVKAAKHLRTPRMWLLSGNPISKWADDLWAQFNIISPKSFTSYWRFAHTYCTVIRDQWGEKVVGNVVRIDARDEFKDIMFTVKEHELGLSKPEMLHETAIIPLNIEQRRVHDELLNTFTAELETGTLETTTVVARLTYLQQIVSHPKNVDPSWKEAAPKLNYLLEQYKAGYIPAPSIIWTWWVVTGEEVYRGLKENGYKVGIYTGKEQKPHNAITLFQEGKLTHLVLSLGVGKYGHTFNMAKSAVYYDRTFDADAFLQSQRRILGGIRGSTVKHTPITYTLKSPGTVDMVVEQNLLAKAYSLSHVAGHKLADLLKGLIND